MSASISGVRRCPLLYDNVCVPFYIWFGQMTCATPEKIVEFSALPLQSDYIVFVEAGHKHVTSANSKQKALYAWLSELPWSEA